MLKIQIYNEHNTPKDFSTYDKRRRTISVDFEMDDYDKNIVFHNAWLYIYNDEHRSVCYDLMEGSVHSIAYIEINNPGEFIDFILPKLTNRNTFIEVFRRPELIDIKIRISQC